MWTSTNCTFQHVRFSSAITAPLDDLPFSFDYPDTLFALFDSNGVQIVSCDDAGDDGWSDLDPDLAADNPAFVAPDGIFGSAIRAVVPADGVYYLGVTGTGDTSFIGSHQDSGPYAILVGVAALPDALPGDFNGDGFVNGADYVKWRHNLGGAYSPASYTTWREHFGQTIGAGTTTAIPEPAAVFLLIVGTLGVGEAMIPTARRYRQCTKKYSFGT